jgi:UDPglucose 6-dehydrogenase
LALARKLMDEGATVVGYDPYAEANARAELAGLETAADVYEALEGAHCVVMCTAWEEFRTLDLDKAKELLAYPIMVDGRNLFDPGEMMAKGFTYLGTGRSTSAGTT